MDDFEAGRDELGRSFFCGGGTGAKEWRWMREHRPSWLAKSIPWDKHAPHTYEWKIANGVAEVYSLVGPDGKGWLWVGAAGPLLGRVSGLGRHWEGERFVVDEVGLRLDAAAALKDFATAFEQKWARAKKPEAIIVSESFEGLGIYSLPEAGLLFEGAEPSSENLAKLMSSLEIGEKRSETVAARAGLILAKAGSAKALKALLGAGWTGNWVLGALADAAGGGHLEAARLLAHSGDPRYDGSRALYLAAIFGHADVVELLAPLSGVEESGALTGAAREGRLAAVEALLPYADPKLDQSEALRGAAAGGFVDVVDKLIPLSDPRSLDSEALRKAVVNGHVEVARRLLEVCDPKAKESEALRTAAAHGQFVMVEILLPFSDADARDDEALRLAARHEFWGMVETLWPGYKGMEDKFVAVLAKSGARAMAHVAKYEKLILESMGADEPSASFRKRI